MYRQGPTLHCGWEISNSTNHRYFRYWFFSGMVSAFVLNVYVDSFLARQYVFSQLKQAGCRVHSHQHPNHILKNTSSLYIYTYPHYRDLEHLTVTDVDLFGMQYFTVRTRTPKMRFRHLPAVVSGQYSSHLTRRSRFEIQRTRDSIQSINNDHEARDQNIHVCQIGSSIRSSMHDPGKLISIYTARWIQFLE
jgi:hypothetical protein